MTGTVLTPPNEQLVLDGISWQTYQTLLEELSHRRLRLTYNRGILEIMAPSPEHEYYKKVLGRFVETIAEELEIKIQPLGSTTFQRPELSGAEPDECFYLRDRKIQVIKGKKRIDLEQDSAPDLVAEIDITSSSKNRFQVYVDLGIKEIWLYDGKNLQIYQLQNKNYIQCQKSLVFPNLPILEIEQFLQQVGIKDYLELVREFRQWVKSRI